MEAECNKEHYLCVIKTDQTVSEMKKLSHAAHSLVSQRGRRGNRGQNVQLHVGTLPARGSELAKGQADLISARVLKPRKRSAT